MHINFKAFLESLPIMAKGMVIILGVMLVICGGIVLFRNLTTKKEK